MNGELQGRVRDDAVKGFLESLVEAAASSFTVRSPKTGAHYTFRTQRADNPEIRFVHVLSGPENTHDFRYIGYVRRGVFVHSPMGSVMADAPSVVAFAWLWIHRTKPAPAEVYHQGNCAKCGRVLTTPESIERGIGPVCLARE